MELNGQACNYVAYSDLLMDLAFNIDKNEFDILLLGVVTRNLITRRQANQIDSFARLLTLLQGRHFSFHNLELLKTLFANIQRKDLMKKIQDYEQYVICSHQYLEQAENYNGNAVFDTDSPLCFTGADDDEEMNGSQKSCVSMNSISDDEKLERRKIELEYNQEM